MQRQCVIVTPLTPPLKQPGGDCLPPPLFLAFESYNQNVRPKVISQSLNILGIGESTNRASACYSAAATAATIQFASEAVKEGGPVSQKRANSHLSIAGGREGVSAVYKRSRLDNPRAMEWIARTLALEAAPVGVGALVAAATSDQILLSNMVVVGTGVGMRE